MPRFGWSGNLYLYFYLFDLADPFLLLLPIFPCLTNFGSSPLDQCTPFLKSGNDS
jgi:hypothetical protein